MEDLRRVLARLEESMDEVKSDISTMKVIQAEQAADLKLHIYRTDLSEENLAMLRTQVDPVLTAYQRTKGVFIFIGIISTGLGLFFTAIKSIEFLKSLI